jgi:mannose-6-phosphate isomerase-like protein (cupin superfamily)
MLSFLRAAGPVRTKVSHLTTLELDNGRSSVSFRSDSDPSSQRHTFRLPPSEPGENPKDNSIVIPPFHAHPKQDEIFLVTKGTALFHLNRNKLPVSAGNEFTIPRGEYHKFSNASSTETVTLEGWYNPAAPAREERFFRNLYGYLRDVTTDGAGMLDSASIPQISLFAWEADMPICEPSKLRPSDLYLIRADCFSGCTRCAKVDRDSDRICADLVSGCFYWEMDARIRTKLRGVLSCKF